MAVAERLSRLLQLVTALLLCECSEGYYSQVKCLGTGDCFIGSNYMLGGFNDEYHRWNCECDDASGFVGIYDNYHHFTGFSQVQCRNMFPAKPPANGIYPFYPWCNVRNLTAYEYYCYDKYFPESTADTFMTAVYLPLTNPYTPSIMKCCKTPKDYHLDYNRCQWKYTHDKNGEHYDGYWVVICDANHIMTGLGTAMNPWSNQLHYTWIQCCPVVHTPQRSRNKRSLLDPSCKD